MISVLGLGVCWVRHSVIRHHNSRDMRRWWLSMNAVRLSRLSFYASKLRGCWKCLVNGQNWNFKREVLFLVSFGVKHLIQQARSLESLREVVLPRPLSVSFVEGQSRREVRLQQYSCCYQSVWGRRWMEQFLSPYMPPHQGMLGMPECAPLLNRESDPWWLGFYL